MSKGIFAPFWSTLLELADSKKAMIFLLMLVAISQADACGFPGVKASYRLAAAVILACCWMLTQSITDIGVAKYGVKLADQPVDPAAGKQLPKQE